VKKKPKETHIYNRKKNEDEEEEEQRVAGRDEVTRGSSFSPSIFFSSSFSFVYVTIST